MIKYQMTIAKIPLAKDIDGLAFDSTPINETLVRDLSNAVQRRPHGRNVHGRNASGHRHRENIHSGWRPGMILQCGDRLDSEARAGRQGRIADYMSRLDFVVLDELGYLPFAQAGGQLLFHLVGRLYKRTSIIVTTNLAFVEWPRSSVTPR